MRYMQSERSKRAHGQKKDRRAKRRAVPSWPAALRQYAQPDDVSAFASTVTVSPAATLSCDSSCAAKLCDCAWSAAASATWTVRWSSVPGRALLKNWRASM